NSSRRHTAATWSASAALAGCAKTSSAASATPVPQNPLRWNPGVRDPRPRDLAVWLRMKPPYIADDVPEAIDVRRTRRVGFRIPASPEAGDGLSLLLFPRPQRQYKGARDLSSGESYAQGRTSSGFMGADMFIGRARRRHERLWRAGRRRGGRAGRCRRGEP